MNIKDTPPLQVYVCNEYLTRKMGSYQEGVLVGVRVQPGQALQFSVLLETGALVTGIPINKIGLTQDLVELDLQLDDAQCFDNIGSDIEVIEHSLLRLMKCSVKTYEEGVIEGYYQFTIEFRDSGLARHPEQWKQFHIISTHRGLIAYPQYRIKFLDSALCPKHDKPFPRYVANTKTHIAEI